MRQWRLLNWLIDLRQRSLKTKKTRESGFFIYDGCAGHGANVGGQSPLYEQAITPGNVAAMNNRAKMHEYVQGGNSDLAEAFQLYHQLAAQSASHVAQRRLQGSYLYLKVPDCSDSEYSKGNTSFWRY